MSPRVWPWIWAVLLGACYRPAADNPCAFACEDSRACPSGTQCTAGRCTLPGGGCGASIEPDVAAGCIDLELVGVVCLDRDALRPLVDSAGEIDTDQDCTVVATDGAGPDVCVVAGTSVTITNKLRAVGSRPLALVAASGSLVLQATGLIDVATRGPALGAGTFNPSCGVPGAGQTEQVGTIGGGGAGGSFRGGGGLGGAGGGTNAGTGGIADAPAPAPSFLAGGCPGGGGAPLMGGGAGGLGGGAIALYAAQQIVIEGTINASGSGGAGCMASGAGGGGAGTGGMVTLQATGVVGAGTVIANGGGGGGGCGASALGAFGSAPDPSSPTTGAGGGPGAGTGGSGGAGSAGANDHGLPGTRGMLDAGDGDGGGGGGGGGAGHILVFAPSIDASLQLSPPPAP